MIGLFIGEWTIYTDGIGNYYDVTLTPDVLERYLSRVDKLKILIRVEKVKNIDQVKNYSKISLEKIEIIPVPNILTFKGIIKNNKKVNLLIKQTIKNIDVAFIRLPSMIGNRSISIIKKRKIPYLIELGGCAWDSYWYHGFKGKLLAIPFFLTTKSSVKNAGNVVYVTNEFLQKRYPTKGEFTSCSNVILKNINQFSLEKRVDKILNFSESGKIVLGTAAAVNVKYKGQQYVIEALAYLVNKGYNIEYQLVGKGERDFLMSTAKKYNVGDRICFLGVMKHGDVLAWMENVDIYIQPSKQEGLPRALIEAMSTASPAIGSKVAGIPELLTNEVIFNKGNVLEIAEIIEKLIRSQSIMKDQMYKNYKKSLNFKKEIIDERRNSFFDNFFMNNLHSENTGKFHTFNKPEKKKE